MTDTSIETTEVPTETPPPVKPGWRTTEFWLSTAAIALTALFASGALTNTTALAIAGMAATVLTALGYKVSRTLVKTAGALLLVLGLGALALQPACATVRPVATVGTAAFIDCEADNLRAGVAELVPLATQAVLAAISGDGRHVDTAPIRAAARALRSDLGRCALATAIAILATPAPAKAEADAPMAAALEVDGAELRAAFESVRPELGGARFLTSAGAI